MNCEINQISQTHHPEIGVKVTHVSQDIIVGKITFETWFDECKRVKPQSLKSIMSFTVFKNYYKQGLTPVQAVKKYFL